MNPILELQAAMSARSSPWTRSWWRRSAHRVMLGMRWPTWGEVRGQWIVV